MSEELRTCKTKAYIDFCNGATTALPSEAEECFQKLKREGWSETNAMLRLHTQEKPNCYRHCFRALKEDKDLDEWGGYVFRLNQAIMDRGTAKGFYRGIAWRSTTTLYGMKKGSRFLWPGFPTASTSKTVAEMWNGHGMLIHFDCNHPEAHAIELKEISQFAGEEEVLMPSCSRFEVSDIQEGLNGTRVWVHPVSEEVPTGINAVKESTFLSLRFGPGTEEWSKDLAPKIKQIMETKYGEDVFLSNAGAGDEFGPTIQSALNRAKLFVAFLSLQPPYGEKTTTRYSSYFELKFALEKNVPLFTLSVEDVGHGYTKLYKKLVVIGDAEGADNVSMALAGTLITMPANMLEDREEQARIIAAKIAEKARANVGKSYHARAIS